MRQLIRQLQHAADGDRPGQRQHRRVEVRRGEQGKTDHADVKKRRRKRRYREAVPGIQDSPHQRSQRDEQNIGESNAQKLRGQGKFVSRIGKPGAVTIITQGAASIPSTVTTAKASVSNLET